MDHRISKDMISNGMTPSGQKSQQDLSRSQYGSAATPASLAEAYRKIHEMKGEMKGPPKYGVNRTPNAKPSPGTSVKPTPTPSASSKQPPKFGVNKGEVKGPAKSGGSGGVARPGSGVGFPGVGRGSGGNTMQSASSSDEPLATLNRAKKGDGYFGPTVSVGGYRMGIPNPIRKEEVEQVNEGEKPMGQHPGKSPDKATRDRYETQSRRATAPTGVGVPDKSVGYGQLKQSVDLFDIVKGHLMSEGLSEEDALKKMLEMTEEEKAEIVEINAGPRGYKRPGTYDPSKFYYLAPGSLPSPNIPFTGPGYSKKSKQKDSVVAHHELKGDVISEGQV